MENATVTYSSPNHQAIALTNLPNADLTSQAAKDTLQLPPVFFPPLTLQLTISRGGRLFFIERVLLLQCHALHLSRCHWFLQESCEHLILAFGSQEQFRNDFISQRVVEPVASPQGILRELDIL